MGDGGLNDIGASNIEFVYGGVYRKYIGNNGKNLETVILLGNTYGVYREMMGYMGTHRVWGFGFGT